MKGILSKPDMIKAIVTGAKTVTRRLAIQRGHLAVDEDEKGLYYQKPIKDIKSGLIFNSRVTIKPRYHVGETVYIKEAWATINACDGESPNKLHTHTPIWFRDTPGDEPTNCGDDRGRWRSPLHLRADHARYFIQITDVRAERLLEITENEAIKEGCWVGKLNSISWYRQIWDNINPKFPFPSNPVVFRYEFKRVERPVSL